MVGAEGFVWFDGGGRERLLGAGGYIVLFILFLALLVAFLVLVDRVDMS